MYKFSTEYYSHTGIKYSGHIVANSFEDAQQKCLSRNTGEVVLGRSKIVLEKISLSNHAQVLHSLSFASWIKLKSSPESVDELYGDDGLVHEYIHRIDFGQSFWGLKKRINELFKSIGLCIRVV